MQKIVCEQKKEKREQKKRKNRREKDVAAVEQDNLHVS